VTFAAADPHGSLATLVNSWNAAHPGERVTLRTLPADPQAHHDSLLGSLGAAAEGAPARAGAPDDLVELRSADVAEFAAQGWLHPLTGRQSLDTGALVPAAVEADRYQGSLYAAPLDVDAGLLYYRSDLLGKPPATWAQLTASCPTAERLSIGCYAGQFAHGTDLTANTLEAVGATGGQITAASKAAPAAGAAAGLTLLSDSYRSGVIPKAALTYRSAQTSQAFLSGSLLFMRNWASAYPAVAHSAGAVPFRTALLPGVTGPGVSAIEGDSVAVTGAARHLGTALAFTRYLQTPGAQAVRLAADGLGPVSSASYTDPALNRRFPVLATLAQALRHPARQPVGPFYPGVSEAISDSSYAAISGSLPVPAAISQLQQAIAAAAR
jgi:multiple sugar transport system substrate-binding protein